MLKCKVFLVYLWGCATSTAVLRNWGFGLNFKDCFVLLFQWFIESLGIFIPQLLKATKRCVLVYEKICGKKNSSELKINKKMKKIYLLIILVFAMSNSYSQKQNRSKSSDPKILVGCWWFPHSATIQIHFRKNGTFVFNDVDETVLKGKYYLNKGTITLSYNDRKPQNFYLRYSMSEGKPYFEIYKKGYVFVKNIENNDCNW